MICLHTNVINMTLKRPKLQCETTQFCRDNIANLLIFICERRRERLIEDCVAKDSYYVSLLWPKSIYYSNNYTKRKKKSSLKFWSSPFFTGAKKKKKITC